jgi:branched-chain amino acid transport system substrate-binding protein
MRTNFIGLRRTKRLGRVGGRALLGAGLLALAGPVLAQSQPVKIGIIASQQTLPGKSIVKGAKLAAEQINQSGGINGRKIKLYFYDTHKSSSDATRAFQRAARQDHTVAVVGTFISEIALSLEPWAARLKTPFIDAGASSVKISQRVHDNYSKYKYVFQNTQNSDFLAEMVIDFIKQDLTPKGFKKAVIMSEDADWTKPLDKTWKQELQSKTGVKILKEIRYSPDTNDYSPIYSKIENTHAKIILTGWSHTGLRPTIQWKQLQVPALLVGVSSQAGNSNFWKATNGATKGVITESGAVPKAALSDKTEPFARAFRKKFNSYPAYTGYTTYDAIHELKDAIEKAGSTDADKIVSAMEKTDMTGTLGHIKFYGKNSQYAHAIKFGKKLAPGVVFQWQNGKEVPLWPKRVATKPMVMPSFVKAPSD